MKPRLVLLFLVGVCSPSQVAQKPSEDYEIPAKRERAAYEIAHWIRPSVEHTAELVNSLELRPANTVANIGTARFLSVWSENSALTIQTVWKVGFRCASAAG